MKTLDSNKAEVLRRIAELKADSAARWGKMSCHQMICHLSDSIRLPLGERTTGAVKPPLPRGFLKWFALSVPLKWPKDTPTGPEMAQGIGGTTPVEFSQDREQLVELVERFAKAASELDHPFFGTMSQRDWLRWGYLHCDHHLRQFGV
jgi:hypothetical protein